MRARSSDVLGQDTPEQLTRGESGGGQRSTKVFGFGTKGVSSRGLARISPYLDGPDVKFEVVYGVSDSNWPLYDLEHGRRSIGYNPQQKSIVTDDFAAGRMDRDPVLHANL